MNDEEDIVRRALQEPVKKGCNRKIPFTTTEQLIDDLTTLYPTLNEIFIYNHDLRDQNGGPVLTTRSHRGLKAVITTTKWSGRVSSTFDAKIHLCFVAVEHNTAYVKITKLTVGET